MPPFGFAEDEGPRAVLGVTRSASGRTWVDRLDPAGASLATAMTQRLGLPEIVSLTATTNLRSQHVMEAIGMTRDHAADFDHPSLTPGHPLRRHVLYRVRP